MVFGACMSHCGGACWVLVFVSRRDFTVVASAAVVAVVFLRFQGVRGALMVSCFVFPPFDRKRRGSLWWHLFLCCAF